MKTRKTKGFTLIETLLVTGFVALASVGVYNIYNKAQAISIAKEEAIMLNQFKKDILSMYDSSDSYLGIDNQTLNNARVTPVKMRGTNITDIINRFGGDVTVGAINYGSFLNSGFRITYPKVGVSSCSNMAISLAENFDSIIINGATVKNYGDQGIDIPTVTNACESAMASVGATMSFEHISTFQVAVAAAVPPNSPTSNTKFVMANNAVVCDIASPSFWVGEAGYPYPLGGGPASGIATIPANIRSNLIFSYKTIDNHLGRCPTPVDYTNMVNLIQTHKTANPNMSYLDVYANIVEPLIISTGLTTSKPAMQADSNALCNAASTATYGSFVSSVYVPYSGNKCQPT